MMFAAGNYMERIDGAVFFSIDNNTLYFHACRLIGLSTSDGVFYAVESEAGIISKRVRAAMKHTPQRKRFVTSARDLKAMADAIIFNAASRMLSEDLTKEK